MRQYRRTNKTISILIALALLICPNMTNAQTSAMPAEMNSAKVIAGADYLWQVEKEIVSVSKLAEAKSSLPEGELSFDQCLIIAKERHLPIEIAKDKIDLHKRKLVKAVRDLFPTLSLSFDHNKGFKLVKGGDFHQRFRSEKWRYALSQPVYRGGSLWNKVHEEKANLQAARAEYEKVFLDLAVEVARAYFNLAKAKSMLNFKETVLVAANNSMTVSEEKMNAGLISEIEHLNVQSQQSQLQHDLEAAKEDIALALIDLQKALHLDVSEPVEVNKLGEEYTAAVKKELKELPAVKNEEEKEQERIVEALVDLAYDRRPEFIIQKSKLEAATYKEKAANGGWFPQINLQFERGKKAEAYTIIDNSPDWEDEQHVALDVRWNIYGSTFSYKYDKNKQGAGTEATDINANRDGYYDRKNTVSFSILDGLDQFAATKEAEIHRKEALLELELSEKDIVSEVKESYFNFNRAKMQMNSVTKRLKYREKLVGLAKHRSEINEIQLSEYIQAEMDFISEQDKLYKAMVDYFVAKISLNKAIGVKEYSPFAPLTILAQIQDDLKKSKQSNTTDKKEK